MQMSHPHPDAHHPKWWGDNTRWRLFGAAACLCVIGSLYVTCLPWTVQGMDTGELVSHAFALQVAHPPGFPVYLWWLHLATLGAPADHVFWRASLASVACAVAALWCVAWGGHSVNAQRAQHLAAWAVMLVPLACERLFWQYGTTPDVFAMHVALTTFVMAAYLRMRPGMPQVLCMGVALALGLANHPTALFVSPLWGVALWQVPRLRDRAFLCAAMGSVVACAYASLILMHPQALDSWGCVDSLPRVVWHALRMDYGVFQLDAHSESAAPLYNLWRLVKHLCEALPVTMLAAFYAIVRVHKDKRLRHCLAVVVAYSLVFFSLANSRDMRVLERFMLMPEVCCVLLGFYALSRMPKSRLVYVVACAALLTTAMRFGATRARVDLSSDTVIEDYARNMLHMPTDAKQSVIVTDDDTRFNAMRYVQTVYGEDKETMVLALGTALSPLRIDKMARVYPHFVVAQEDAAHPQSFLHRMMLPNRDGYTFYFTPRANFPGFNTRILALGRAVGTHVVAGVDHASFARLTRRFRPAYDLWAAEDDVARALYLDYCDYYLASARFAETSRMAQMVLEQGLVDVADCRPALMAACARQPNLDACRNRLAAIAPLVE